MAERSVWIVEYKPKRTWVPCDGCDAYLSGLTAERVAESYNHRDPLTAYRATKYVPEKAKTR